MTDQEKAFIDGIADRLWAECPRQSFAQVNGKRPAWVKRAAYNAWLFVKEALNAAAEKEAADEALIRRHIT